MIELYRLDCYRSDCALSLSRFAALSNSDAALAVVTSALNAAPDLQTPRDIQRTDTWMVSDDAFCIGLCSRAIQVRVGPLFASYGMECIVDIVDEDPGLH